MADMVETDTRPIVASELPELFAGLEGYAHVFLAVSGGADSTALMYLVAEWCRVADVGKAGHQRPAVTVLTVDHGLRQEAAEEAEAVALKARSLGLGAEVLSWSGPKPDSGVQDAARTARYDLMSNHIRQVVADPAAAAIVTAHHRDDIAETLLMRLARGAGIDGLAGIPARGFWQDVAVLRPLLDLPKSRLCATLEAGTVSWSEDPSNQDEQFERVRLRRAFAARRELGLGDAALSLTARRMARARQALEAMTEAWLVPRMDAPSLLQAGIFVWPVAKEAPQDEIAIRALMRVLPAIGGIAHSPRLSRVERLWSDMQLSGFAGATLGNCIVRREAAGGFEIFREPERGALPEIETEPGRTVIWDNRFEIESDLKLQVRPLRPGDLEFIEGEPRLQPLPHPLDALQATPVFVDEQGILAIPALNVHREGEGGLMSGRLTCRFLCERLARTHAADQR